MPEEFKDDWIKNMFLQKLLLDCTDGAHFLTRSVSQPAIKTVLGAFFGQPLKIWPGKSSPV